MRHDFAVSVPNGWGDTIRKQVPSTTWRRMLDEHNAWLTRHHDHPAADLIRLDKVRIYFFASQSDDAWRLLIDLLPRRPNRALAEMRYLLVQGMPPSAAQIDSLTDPVLITALCQPERVTPERWRRWWSLAQQAPQTAWSLNLQERLLLVAARWTSPNESRRATMTTLPPAFPQQARRITPLWGKLRAITLLQTNKTAAAVTQLKLAAPDPEQAALAAHVHYGSGDYVAGARLAQLDGETRHYFISVMANNQQLAQLRGEGSDDVATVALFERAVRRNATGDWLGAARLIDKAFPAHATLWRTAGALAKDHSSAGKLQLARFLVEHEREIFDEPGNGWYRGLSWRYRGVKKASERQKIAAHFQRRSARWRALQLFTQWLSANPNHHEARGVVDEADKQYNRLINRGGGTEYFWGTFAEQSREVRQLRQVGRHTREVIAAGPAGP